jgi:hypothetical protein
VNDQITPLEFAVKLEKWLIRMLGIAAHPHPQGEGTALTALEKVTGKCVFRQRGGRARLRRALIKPDDF